MEVFNFDASQSYRDSGGGLAQTSHSKALLSSAASLISHSETHSESSRSRHVAFMREGKVTHVEVFFANVKKPSRMREKLARYEPPYPGSRWPLTAHILDPVRLSVVCSGPSDIMQVSSRHSPLRPPFSLPLPSHFDDVVAHAFCRRRHLFVFHSSCMPQRTLSTLATDCICCDLSLVPLASADSALVRGESDPDGAESLPNQE